MSNTSMNNGLKATIHQPDFMPWLGFYKKISKADIWIILDHVENNPRHKGYWNRVKFLINGSPIWISVPVLKDAAQGHLGLKLNKFIIYELSKKEISKRLKSFEFSYKKTKYFDLAFELYRKYFESDEPLLIKRNIEFINETLKILGINTKIQYSSQMNITSRSNQMLIDILKSVGASQYIHGDGASGYQDDVLFQMNNISVEANNFVHPKYAQILSNNFVAGLSVLDAIANIGSNDTRSILGI